MSFIFLRAIFGSHHTILTPFLRHGAMGPISSAGVSIIVAVYRRAVGHRRLMVNSWRPLTAIFISQTA